MLFGVFTVFAELAKVCEINIPSLRKDVWDAKTYAASLTRGQIFGVLPEGISVRFPGLEGEELWLLFQEVYVEDTNDVVNM